jgi:HEAT repeat protein
MIRRDAIRVASFLRDDSIHAAIVKCLSDEDAIVRRIASKTLKQSWPRSKENILQIIEQKSNIELDAALDSIPTGDPLVFAPLRAYIEREILNIRFLRSLVHSLPRNGRAMALLIETLKHRESVNEERLIKAVGLFGREASPKRSGGGNSRALDLIRRSLNPGDASKRAAALEALETLGDRRITQEILPLLDSGGVLPDSGDQKRDLPQVIEMLLSNEDYWLRALTARSIPELDLQEFVPTLHVLSSDSVLLVSQAAADALARMEDGAKMKTLKTISTLERILLLREVPMFSRLSPEDLEQIAEIAQEQLYSNGALICNEGEPGDTLFIIVDGNVEVIKKADRQETVIAMRGAGEFVGEMAILESAPRFASLKAHGDVRVLMIEGEAFTAILLDRPEVAVSVLRHMSQRVRALNERAGVSPVSSGLVK